MAARQQARLEVETGLVDYAETNMKRLLVWLSLGLMGLPLAAEDWPQWRGPQGTGVAPDADPPVRFGESENLRFKVAIAGQGHASPIIVGDRVFLLSAVPTGRPTPKPELPPDADERTRRRFERAVHPVELRFLVLAYARRDGGLLWQRVALETVPVGPTHRDATWASASPVSDGERIYAQFGSQGLFAYSVEGQLLWQRDLGDMRTRNGFGEGSSPVIAGDLLIVNWDHEDASFIVALDKRTGETVWRKDRDEVTSWSTPLLVQVGDTPQVIVAATDRSRAYDARSGDVIWQVGGMTTNVVPSPVEADGIVYLMSGFRGAALQAVRLAGARGELTGTEAVVWSHDRDTPYVPSPLLYDGRLYFLKVNTGILTVMSAETGTPIYGPQRLDGITNIYASPVAANGRVYLAGRDGTVLVIANGDAYEVLAENSLDEGIDASPAIAGDALFVRGRHHLYAFARPLESTESAASAATER